MRKLCRTVLIVAATALAIIVSPFAAEAAFASHSSWGVDDSCSRNPYADPYFYIAGDTSRVGISYSGHNGCHIWVPTHTYGVLVTGVEYYLPTSSSYNGNYSPPALIPCNDGNHGGKVTDAHYLSYPNGSGGSFVRYRINQQSYNCSYVHLSASTSLNGNNGAKMHTNDASTVFGTLEWDRFYWYAVH